MTDYSVFASPEFDANEYANAVLAGEPYQILTESRAPAKASRLTSEPLAKEDISVAISKLSSGIDDVSRQIKNVVSVHHEELLSQAERANELSGSLTSARTGLSDLDNSLERLKLKIRVPYQALQVNVTRLQKLQQASDVLRRTSRFVTLIRRLQLQMAEMDISKPSENILKDVVDVSSTTLDGVEEKDRAIAKAALSIAELVTLLDSGNVPDPGALDPPSDVSLRSISIISDYEPFIDESRTRVTTEMRDMVMSGLSNLDQSLLASSLQTAYNLRVLPELVQGLMLDLTHAVEDLVRNAFDLSKISKDVKDPPANLAQGPANYKSRIRTEPTNLTAPQWSAALWIRLEGLIEDVSECCIKASCRFSLTAHAHSRVYSLEKVLKVKKDATTQVNFLDEAMKLLDSRPSTTFWSSLSQTLEKHAKDGAKTSTFLHQALSSGYPKLLRLFHELFAKIAVHTDTIYSSNAQSPETVLVLRAFSTFETSYLSRSSNKVNETIGQAFSGAPRNPPGPNDAANVVRTLANELDSARFDPLLVKSVAKNSVSSLQLLLTRTDSFVARDRLAVTLVGSTATASQIVNGSLASFLYHCSLKLDKLHEEYSDDIIAPLDGHIKDIRAAYNKILEPIMLSVRRELTAIIAKLHRINFERKLDPMSGMDGASFYMKDLVDKLQFIKLELLSQYSIGEAGKSWVLDIVRLVIRTFVLHVSIAKPLGESGKLQLTSDMTALEFALNAFMSDGTQNRRGGSFESLGEEYKLLRALRPLLFLDNTQLASPAHTVGLPPLVVLHHIMVRSPIPLPHSLHGWQEAEYVRWIEERSEEAAWALVEGGLTHWEKTKESEGKDTADAKEYIELARVVLRNARS
ncbi:hypothetical protein BDN72DRAFT_954963 [Pluteus cervinus]|uniref:Uncharacterized protein n=1 Tax=Pluteus cervinus TaxID=181527 RepID=A0ACD3BBW7_9AGAR|nr:hypothetical protein BDN72DRAFT_954963 [Pluteus cervinus]